jgi:hypothetical protein
MKMIGGHFNGTGAAVYICCGFVPDFVKLWSVEAATVERAEWSVNMVGVLANEGVQLPKGGGANIDMAKGEGITPYWGGDLLTTTTAGTTTYGEGVYLKWDDRDFRTDPDGTYGTINKWTLGNSTNFTGNWNVECNTTYVGVGSRIKIAGKWYSITALTSNGESANEVTLSHAPATGVIEAIKGMYSMCPMVANEVTPAGFKINSSTEINKVNVNNGIVAFQAVNYGI